MSILDMFPPSRFGETIRLDWVIEAHDRLETKYTALLAILQEKGVLTHDENVELRPNARLRTRPGRKPFGPVSRYNAEACH